MTGQNLCLEIQNEHVNNRTDLRALIMGLTVKSRIQELRELRFPLNRISPLAADCVASR